MAADVSRPTSEPRPGIAAGLLHGLAAGLAAGAGWWIVETTANWAFGGVMPADVALAVLAIDLGLGAAGGVLAGLVLTLVGASGAVTLGLAMAAVYGFVRVYGPPGYRAEALFVVLAVASVALGRRLAAKELRGPLGFAHVMLVTTAFTALGKAIVGEAQSDYFSKTEPTGMALVLLLAGLPLAGLLVDRLIALVLRKPNLRFAAELVLAAAAAVLWHSWSPPLWTPPLDRPGPATAKPAAPGAPDVILISMDTTRADHMSTYGYARETSPNLTALAKDGLSFTAARSPAQWTVPGHASMFTGMYPSRHGAHYAGDWHSGPAIYGRKRVFPLADDKTTVAEMLAQHGYATAGFVANFANLDRGVGMAQGAQRWEDHPWLLFRPVPHAVRFWQRFRPADFKKPFRSADDLNAAALAWMDGLPKGKPAFVFLNYLEPHHWLAAAPYDLWAREVPNARVHAQKGLFTHAIPAGLTPEERAFVTANYDGQILAMDAALGRLVAALKERGRYENTLIIVTSDHGELLGEHDIVGHGGRMMYEGLLHIPMVAKLPGADRPRAEIATPVQLVDVLPTVAAVTGASAPADVQGEPLQRVTHQQLAEEHINPEFVAQFGAVYNRALRVYYDGGFKLITTSRGERYLFDLANDREETENLASREPERVARMEGALESMMSTMDSKVALASPTTTGTITGARAADAIGVRYR